MIISKLIKLNKLVLFILGLGNIGGKYYLPIQGTQVTAQHLFQPRPRKTNEAGQL